MYRENQRARADQCDRCEIPYRVVGKLLVEARVDNMAARYEREGIAIGRSARSDFRSDDAVCARPVFNDELLLEALRELRRDGTADGIVAATRRKYGNDPYRLRRVGLLRARGERERAAKDERGTMKDDLEPARLCEPGAG